MKIRLSVVPQYQVVKELLDAMDRSIDYFSQDRTFDFCLVRVDQFRVPPRRLERFDDACLSYLIETNVHPSHGVMKQVLMRGSGESIVECLNYAAVLYRNGGFDEHAHWGAYFYFKKPVSNFQAYVRVDCRENDIERDPAPNSVINLLPGTDRFTLSWVLAMATKKIHFENRRELQHDQGAYKNILSKEYKIAAGLRCFQSGLGEIGTLSKKMNEVTELYSTVKEPRRRLRYEWASATLRDALPPATPGAGQHLEKLFTELNAIKTA